MKNNRHWQRDCQRMISASNFEFCMPVKEHNTNFMIYSWYLNWFLHFHFIRCQNFCFKYRYDILRIISCTDSFKEGYLYEPYKFTNNDTLLWRNSESVWTKQFFVPREGWASLFFRLKLPDAASNPITVDFYWSSMWSALDLVELCDSSSFSRNDRIWFGDSCCILGQQTLVE